MEESKRRSPRIAYLPRVSLTLLFVVPVGSQLQFPYVNTSPGHEYASQNRRWCVSNFHIQLDPAVAVIDSLLAEKGR